MAGSLTAALSGGGGIGSADGSGTESGIGSASGNGIGSGKGNGNGSGSASGAPASKIREDNEIEVGPHQIEGCPFQFQTFSIEIEMNTSLCEVFRYAKYFA